MVPVDPFEDLADPPVCSLARPVRARAPSTAWRTRAWAKENRPTPVSLTSPDVVAPVKCVDGRFEPRRQDAVDRLFVELQTDHGGDVECPTGLFAKQRQPASDHAPRAGRDAGGPELGRSRPRAVSAVDEGNCLQVGKQRSEEERVAIGAAPEALASSPGGRSPACRATRSATSSLSSPMRSITSMTWAVPTSPSNVEGSWVESLRRTVARMAVRAIVSRMRCPSRPRGRRLRPLQIVDHDQQRTLGCHRPHHRGNRLQQPPTPCLGVCLDRRRSRHRAGGQIRLRAARARRRRGPRSWSRTASGHAPIHGPNASTTGWYGAAISVTSPVEHRETIGRRCRRNGGGEPCLADPRLANEEQRVRTASHHVVEQQPRPPCLGAPPDQRRGSWRGPSPRATRGRPRHAAPARTPRSPRRSREHSGPTNGTCSHRPRELVRSASATNTDPPAASPHNRLASIAAVPTQSIPLRIRSPLLIPTRRQSSSP